MVHSPFGDNSLALSDSSVGKGNCAKTQKILQIFLSTIGA